jgi:acetyl esterase/lipase
VPYGPDLMDALARDLSARGWSASCVSYRRVGEAGGGWPGTFEDVQRSVAGADVVIGHSAGGHLALWAACSVEPPPRLAVSLCGVVDLYACYSASLSRGAVVELLGGTPDEVPERYTAGSPKPCGVPTLLVHGADDDLVPPSFSSSWPDDDAEVVIVEGVGQFVGLDPSSRSWAEVVKRLW